MTPKGVEMKTLSFAVHALIGATATNDRDGFFENAGEPLFDE